MKQKMEGLTPLQMDEMEKGRLPLEEAQEMANMIITKFEGFDLSKLEPEDYEKAMKEIEEIKKWANGKETTVDKLILVLRDATILSTVCTIGWLGFMKFLEEMGRRGSLSILDYITTGSLSLLAAVAVTRTPSIQEEASEKELLDLKNKTEQRLAAEKKYQK